MNHCITNINHESMKMLCSIKLCTSWHSDIVAPFLSKTAYSCLWEQGIFHVWGRKGGEKLSQEAKSSPFYLFQVILSQPFVLYLLSRKTKSQNKWADSDRCLSFLSIVCMQKVPIDAGFNMRHRWASTRYKYMIYLAFPRKGNMWQWQHCVSHNF